MKNYEGRENFPKPMLKLPCGKCDLLYWEADVSYKVVKDLLPGYRIGRWDKRSCKVLPRASML